MGEWAQQAYSARGSIYLLFDGHENAIRDLSKAIDLWQDCKETFRYRGFAREALGMTVLALGDWRIAAKMGNEKAKDILERKNITLE